MKVTCPVCAGRKVIAWSVDEIPCAECAGTGSVTRPKPKKPPK